LEGEAGGGELSHAGVGEKSRPYGVRALVDDGECSGLRYEEVVVQSRKGEERENYGGGSGGHGYGGGVRD